MFKKVLTFMLIITAFTSANTIDVSEWKPDFKYTSIETYSYYEAKEYCDNEKDCHISCSNQRCTINKSPKNCPELKTGKMDEYIGKPFDMVHIIDICFTYGKREVHISNGDIKFKHKNTIYYFSKIYKYDNEKWIYKISKKPRKKDMKFREN